MRAGGCDEGLDKGSDKGFDKGCDEDFDKGCANVMGFDLAQGGTSKLHPYNPDIFLTLF